MKVKSLPMFMFFPISQETVNIISLIFILAFFAAVYLFYRFIIKPMPGLQDVRKRGDELRRARAETQTNAEANVQTDSKPQLVAELSSVNESTETFCGNCGATREKGGWFCGECGQRFDN